jgi:hypothetical protein
MKKRWFFVPIIAVIIAAIKLISISPALAAIGCTLNNPDQDIKRIFPQSTSFRTTYITIERRGGQAQFRKLERLLGDSLDTVYETIDTPFTYYDVFQGEKQIGRVHGVNQRGKFGAMQVILATDMNGKILSWYYQRLSSPDARLLRSDEFYNQFRGLTLADFYKHDYFRTDSKYSSMDKIGQIKNPAPNSREDFDNTIRAMRKNLILLDEFHFKGSQERFFDQSQKLLNKT